jgi:hypothetical protein
MERIKHFRRLLAEAGIEMMPDQAESAYMAIKKFKKAARRLSTEDLWAMEEDESSGMPREERMALLELYRTAREM